MRTLELFTDPVCFSRENSLCLIREVLKDFPDISFKEVNMLQEHQRANALGVKMSPTLVLDGRIISMSIPDEQELKALLSGRREGVSHV